MSYSLDGSGLGKSGDPKRDSGDSDRDPLKMYKIGGAVVALLIATFLMLWNADIIKLGGNPEAKLPPPSVSEEAVKKNPGKTPAMVEAEIQKMPEAKRPPKAGS